MIAAIIQARMGSERLPGKSLADVAGKPLLERVVQRVKASTLVDRVIVATTTAAEDDPLADLAGRLEVPCFRGHRDDVLDRVYHAARNHGAEHVVRVTGDCPLIDPGVMDRVIQAYLAGTHDYVSNTIRYTYPDGLDVEVCSFPALERAWKEAHLPSEREHVTSYIRTSGHFRTSNVEGPEDLSRFKLSVDTPEDLHLARSIYEALGDKEPFDLKDVMTLLGGRPDLVSVNAASVVNEGYYASLLADGPIPARDLPVGRSLALKDRSLALIPSGSQTFSKGPTQFVQGMAPVFLQRGSGSHVWDVDGNEYVDYILALGPVILGHNYPAVTEAAVRQMAEGVAFSLAHPVEVELAELLVEIIPSAEMVRFGKNGSDATSAAVRVARAYTGREMVACCGYHGWQDWFIGTTTRNKGVPGAVQELTTTFKYNDINSLEEVFARHPGRVAAVVMEPFGVEEPVDDFLQKVREAADREGAILVYDEVITGFRLAMGGAQEHFGVVPDLACFGKAMGNGFPISAVVGRRDIMALFDEVFFSSTFGGEAVSLAAAVATINEMRKENMIAHLWSQGRKLQDGYNVLARELGVEGDTGCIGLPPRTVLTFKDGDGQDSLALKSLFQQECLKRGLLTGGYHNLCYSHSDRDIDYTLRVYRTVLEILSQAIREGDVRERLEGEPLEPVFRRA